MPTGLFGSGWLISPPWPLGLAHPVVFMRRLHDGEEPSGPAWLNLVGHVNRDGVAFQINEYFAANPHMMLGRMANTGTMYRSNETAIVPDDRDLVTALAGAVAALPQGSE